MKVKLHTLFRYQLDTTEADPEAFIGFYLSESPRLGPVSPNVCSPIRIAPSSCPDHPTRCRTISGLASEGRRGQPGSGA